MPGPGHHESAGPTHQTVYESFFTSESGSLTLSAVLPLPANMALFLLPGQSPTVHTGVPFSKPGARHG